MKHSVTVGLAACPQVMSIRANVFSFVRDSEQLTGSAEVAACGSFASSYSVAQSFSILAPLSLAVAHTIVTYLLARESTPQ